VSWCACGEGFLKADTHRMHQAVSCQHPVVRRLRAAAFPITEMDQHIADVLDHPQCRSVVK
jgi:hypothetical protein